VALNVAHNFRDRCATAGVATTTRPLAETSHALTGEPRASDDRGAAEAGGGL
jgi:hypothetical protein